MRWRYPKPLLCDQLHALLPPGWSMPSIAGYALATLHTAPQPDIHSLPSSYRFACCTPSKGQSVACTIGSSTARCISSESATACRLAAGHMAGRRVCCCCAARMHGSGGKRQPAVRGLSRLCVSCQWGSCSAQVLTGKRLRPPIRPTSPDQEPDRSPGGVAHLPVPTCPSPHAKSGSATSPILAADIMHG